MVLLQISCIVLNQFYTVQQTVTNMVFFVDQKGKSLNDWIKPGNWKKFRESKK